MTELLPDVARYYSLKLAEHGPTSRGVDWNGEESQTLRFAQLAKLIDRSDAFSVNDLGCGYGAFLAYLSERFENVIYRGVDVSAEMVESGKSSFGTHPNASFSIGAVPTETSDYGFASGIFNVRLDRRDDEWQKYMEDTLDAIDRTSARGFAFNCLTSYSDAHRMKDYLFYANPAVLFDLCKRKYSQQVALLHDYGLYEFTMIVRKK